MKTPAQEYFETKQASAPGGTYNRLADAAKGALLTGGVSAGAAGLGLAAQKVYDAITKSRDFRLMLEHNPDLHEQLAEKPKLFNQAYSSLRTLNPAFGKDPIIAGSYMRQVMDAPLTAGGVLEQSLDHSMKGHSPMLDAFGKGALEGSKFGLK